MRDEPLAIRRKICFKWCNNRGQDAPDSYCHLVYRKHWRVNRNSQSHRHRRKYVRGPRSVLNGADGISDIEGKATRVGASERGKRTSSNGVTTGDSTPRMLRFMISRERMNIAETETSNPPTDGFAVANIPIHNFAFILLTFFRPSHRKKSRL